MAWQTPKTDWHGAVDANGVYSGDRFNAADFNRIKNNLTYLRDHAIKVYAEFNIVSLGNDRTPKDYFYADEINQLEANLVTINGLTGLPLPITKTATLWTLPNSTDWRGQSLTCMTS